MSINKSTKPGKCPKNNGIIGICLVTEDHCFGDADCAGDLKCCSFGCGSICSTPSTPVIG